MIRPRLQFVIAALGVAGGAWPSHAWGEALRVQGIRVAESAGATAVVIAASARPTFSTWKLEAPPRLVIEIAGARLGNVDVPLDAGTRTVGLISASATGDEDTGPRARIVFTLRQSADYRVEAKGNDIILRVTPRAPATELPALDPAHAQTQAHLDATAAASAREDKAQRQAALALAARAQADAEARAKAQRAAEASLRDEKEQRQAALALAARAQADAEARAKAQRAAEASLRDEREQRQAALALAARAQADAEARAKAQRASEASLRDEREQRQAALALAAQTTQAGSTARSESERLRRELEATQQEVALAHADAKAAIQERQRLGAALAHAETAIAAAQAETDRARKRAALAESEAAQNRQRQLDRDNAVRVAVQEIESRQKSLDLIALAQSEQGRKLAAAELLVTQREAAVRTSQVELVAREKEAQRARALKDGLARTASRQRRDDAEALVAEAERQRQEAASSARKSRQELAAAVVARRQEEARKQTQEQARAVEEDKLEHAMALRKSEEARLAEARAQQLSMRADQDKLRQEQAELAASRDSLLAEVKRLKEVRAAASRPASSASQPASAATQPEPLPATSANPRLATRPEPASLLSAARPAAPPTLARSAARAEPAPPPALARAVPAAEVPRPSPASLSHSHSVTLQPLVRVRSIDFVDEPAHASVIVAVDDVASFVVERVAGHRLSLRLEHSDLPDNLARNLDATEYLGPVKIVSSYRDPAARATVRIDVDLAEDVPNRVRLEGNRIYWDFLKIQAQAPTNLAPTVRFLPARKVAGFFATVAKASLVGQMTQLPFLAPPPGSSAPSGASPASGTTPAASDGQLGAAAPAGPTGVAGGGSGAGAGTRYTTLGKKRYTGRRIDLDFKGADIHNILRLLADVGQVNVVVADDVKGDVTIKMRDVPWDQALDVVLRSKALGAVREGNLLRVAPLALLEKELEAEIARQKQIAEVVPVETRLIGVSYADSGDLMDRARDLLSPRGKMSHDRRTNTLIVSDVSKNLQLIEDLVRNLDTQTSQVTIEARIVEADSNFTRQIGVQWGGTAFADTTHGNPTGLSFPYNVGIGGGADDSSAPTGGLVPGPRTGTGTTGNPNFLVNMPAPTGIGTSAIGVTLGSVSGAFNLNLRLSAMETTGQVRILSSPRITTMDNVEAKITQGVSIPVSVVSAMGAQTQFVDAQLSLTVKPHVTNEGTIAMLVYITNNAPDFTNTGANGDPTIDKKEAKTTMLVRDGDTAVIGGIYTRNTGVSYTKVPFLADIPVLGWFFRSKTENDNRSEFIVFITPRIANRARALGQ
jgi:type IV pilus assembly protein PilQ